MKKSIIIANWKMNPQTIAEAKKLFNSVEKGIKNIKNTEVVICPPFVYFPIFQISNSKVQLGAQDCFWEEKGAFTGAISAKMLKDLNAKYVIIGHSERKKNQKETDEMINRKIKSALLAGLKTILCVENVSQIKKDLKGVFGKIRVLCKKNLILAYEPIFAIGTGKPCSIEKAKEMKIAIQKALNANNPVLYGGSVNSQNAEDYIKKAGFQGLLVGGVSLKPKEFIATVKKID